MEIITHQSAVFPTHGIVNLQLFQHNSGYNPLGKRLGFDEESNIIYPTPDEIVKAKKIIALTKPNTLSIIPLQKGFEAAKNELAIASIDRTIVCLRGIDDSQKNITYIATKGELIQQEKITLSTEDQKRHVKNGNILNVFRSIKHPVSGEESVSWAILNCHDYTNVTILDYILREKIELLLVVSSNPATRLYWEYAISDIHRLFCFIAISNIAEIGGSAVFAPFRMLGEERNAKFRAGGQIFGSRGNSEFEVNIPLAINELRKMRYMFSESGLKNVVNNFDKEISDSYIPIIPSEHFLHSFDRMSGSPLAYLEDASIQEHKLTYELINPKIAIAQLKDIGFKVYVDTMYRIRNDQKVHAFCDHLRLKLRYLEEELSLKTETDRNLDFLVFPEVFIPRSFLPELQIFSNKHQTTIICGVDYPDGKEEENLNQCFILQPNTPSLIYTKITRSQYDAISTNGVDRMPLSRGNTLLRFLDPKGRGFGLLICYDYSHIDLLTHLNLSNRLEPLEFLFVIAHNPFSKLYKSCCIADSHRFYQYIIMCNVAQYGGSGVFGPIRTKGERQTILDMGIGIEAFGICELDIEALIKARQSSDEALHFNEFMRKPGLFQKVN